MVDVLIKGGHSHAVILFGGFYKCMLPLKIFVPSCVLSLCQLVFWVLGLRLFATLLKAALRSDVF